MSCKQSVSMLEEKLFKAKRNKYVCKLINAALSFTNVVNQYRPYNHDEQKIFKNWVSTFFDYESNLHLKFNRDVIKNLPKYIEERLIDEATTDFIDSISYFETQIEEIEESLKNLHK